MKDAASAANILPDSCIAGHSLCISFRCSTDSEAMVCPREAPPPFMSATSLSSEPPIRCDAPQTVVDADSHEQKQDEVRVPPQVQTTQGFQSSKESTVKTYQSSDGQVSWNPSALLNLQGKQLTTLVPPTVPEVALCAAMRDQQITSGDRLRILGNQETVWGDDEIVWHLARCVTDAEEGTIWLDPLLAISWVHSLDIEALQGWFDQQANPTCIVSCLFAHGHWTPVVWKLGTKVSVHTWDHESVDQSWLGNFHSMICKVAGIAQFQVSHTLRTFAYDHLCGAAAIAFVAHILLGNKLPRKESHLLEHHRQCRGFFMDFVRSHHRVPRPWCWGSGPLDLTESLATLLQQHGVPLQVSASRAKLVLQSLGRNEVEKALRSASPWKNIKALANLHKPVIQLVLSEEQDAFVLSKGDSKAKPKKKSGLGKPFTPTKPADLDPAKLILEPGSFRVEGDVPVQQISLEQVGPLASGVALTTLSSTSSFLRAGQLLTKQGLALLILNAANEPQTPLQWSSIRFAAKCAINQEPMLLTGFLVQIGQIPIYMFKDTKGVPIVDVAVACARITVFQDQWEGDWESFQSKPVKACMAILQPLQTCKKPECTCESWHPTTEASVTDAVLDVFRRQYFSESGRPVVWTKATYFAFCVIYVKSQEISLLACSGKRGLYVEPKTEDATAPHLDFQVVWLPQLDFSEITHKAQCEALSLGIARSGGRYGVRMRGSNFQQVFQSLKPDGLYLPPGPRSMWHCGPWPFGVDRKSLAKVFRQWHWEARPLQPVHAVQGGMMWTAQAVCEPPQAVYASSHGQVVISKCKPAAGSPGISAEIIGQSSTVQLCTSTKADDPWLTSDPWQAFSFNDQKSVGQAPVATQIADLENRLEQSLLAKLPVGNMEVDDQDHRIQALESQVAQLVGRQQALEVTVAENHTQSSAQVQQLQAQMSAQMDLQGRKMQSMLDDQMARLESFLSKRGRHE